MGLTEGRMGKQEQEDGIREQRRKGNNMKNLFLSARKCRQISILVLSFSFVGGYYCESCHFCLYSLLLFLFFLCCCTSCYWTLYIFSLYVPFHPVSLAPRQAFLSFSFFILLLFVPPRARGEQAVSIAIITAVCCGCCYCSHEWISCSIIIASAPAVRRVVHHLL